MASVIAQAILTAKSRVLSRVTSCEVPGGRTGNWQFVIIF
jgi:hypothetical protein